MKIDDGSSDVYNLSQSISHHKNTLRTITCNQKGLVVTGSLDQTCAFFTRSEETGQYNFIKSTNYHNDYVNIVRPEIRDFGFFTGSKDTKIIYMDNDGNPLGEYIGHTGPVNDISQAEAETFISGSWDATARIWDVNSQKCLFMLKDHSYAVSTLALDNRRYITGSQDKKLRFWDKDKVFKSVDNAHDDIIRAIILAPDRNSIFTCGNDYIIKQWTLNGELIDQLTGHDGYIYRICMNKSNNLLFSASDDRIVKTWKNGKCNQDLFHPNTVWDVAINPINDDLLTGCGDGVMRVFSNNPDKWLSEQDLEEYTNLCLFTTKEDEQSNESVDVNKLPLIEDMYRIPNPKEGEIRVFNNQGNAEAYVYKLSERKWDKIGDVLGTKQDKKYYLGDKYFPSGNYDYVFDVDLEGNPSKLPFNKGDNCLVSAEKFAAREGLNKGLYVDDITKFLRQNTQQGGNFKQVERKPQSKKPTSTVSVKFPVTTYQKYDSINIEGPLKKILEINTTLLSNNDPLALSSSQIETFKGFLSKIGKIQFYHTSSFTLSEIELFTKTIGRWSLDCLVPYLDTFRMFLLHPKSNEMFQKIGGGIQELTILLEILKKGSDVQKILVLRILNNMFINESSGILMHEKRGDILDAASVYLDSKIKNISSALGNLLFNYSILLSDKNDNEAFLQVLSLINEMIINEVDAKTIISLLLAIGNLVFNSEVNKSIANDMDIQANLKEISIKDGDSQDLKEINELKTFLLTVLK